MGGEQVNLTSGGADSLTEKVVFLRMLIEKAKLLDVRMTDFVKGFLREHEEKTEQEIEDEKLSRLRPQIQVEPEEKADASEDEQEGDLQIEFDEEEEEEESELENGEGGQMDFGNKFRRSGEDEEPTRDV